MKTLSFCLQNAKPFELSFDITSTVLTAKKFLSIRFGTIPDNIMLTYKNYEFLNNTFLKDIHLPYASSISISFTHSRYFKFLQPGKQSFDLPFIEDATISDVKIALSPRLKVAAERINCCYDGQSLSDENKLIDLNIPENRMILIEVIEDQIPMRKYMFLLQGEGHEIPFGEEATIADVKEILMNLASPATKRLKLFHDGRSLNDDSITLGSLKIPNDDFIIVETEMLTASDIKTGNIGSLTGIPFGSGINSSSPGNTSSNKLRKSESKVSNAASKILHDKFEFQPPEREMDPPPDPMNS